MTVLYLQGPSVLLNPLSNRRIIDAAYESDPEVARAEWGGQFRSDVSAYLSDDVIDHALCPGERSRARMPEIRYVGFVDPAGAGEGGDAMTCAIAHQGARGRLFVDQLLAIDTPFDTEAAVERCALVLKSFGVAVARSDRYAGQWPTQSFARHGIHLVPSELTRSQIYSEVAPLFVSRLVSLVDDPRLEVELRGLERTPKSGGRPDVIDHPPGKGSHDDRINAVAGALWLANQQLPANVREVVQRTSHARTDYDPLTLDEDRDRARGNEDPRPPWMRPTIFN